jgi:hypothetical protein
MYIVDAYLRMILFESHSYVNQSKHKQPDSLKHQMIPLI